MMTGMLGGLAAVVTGLARGPVLEIVEKLVTDRDLKEKLKDEIDARLIEHASALSQAQREVLLAELTQGNRLQRWWRPLLMYLIMAILSVYGLVLPTIEAMTGATLAFEPHWGSIPDGLWTLLTLGLGGYIGGRTVEKIALARAAAPLEPAAPRQNVNAAGSHRR